MTELKKPRKTKAYELSTCNKNNGAINSNESSEAVKETSEINLLFYTRV